MTFSGFLCLGPPARLAFASLRRLCVIFFLSHLPSASSPEVPLVLVVAGLDKYCSSAMPLVIVASRASLAVVSATPARFSSGASSGLSKIRSGRRRPTKTTGHPPCLRLASSSASATTSATNAAKTEARSAKEAQKRAYEHYRRKNEPVFPFNLFRGERKAPAASQASVHDRNVKIASYAAAAVIGALGATYASVPLYKVFCQATGFGGTTQRVSLSDWAQQQEEREAEGKTGRTGKISQALWSKLKEMSNVPAELLPSSPGASHGRSGPKTWTDEEAAARLAELKPVKDGRLITVRFDSTVGDVMPWEFVPTQLDVKVVPGETALSFFTATNNHPDKAITGVATYNVHPPRAGLYFNKIQCFCFEEQRLLPGETVE